VNEPQINVDHFCHRPVYNVVGLLTDKSQLPAISSELRSAGVDVAYGGTNSSPEHARRVGALLGD